MKRMNPVVHFEMAYDNAERISAFYTKTFGWKTKDLGKDMNNYNLATTGETDEDGMLQNQGNINGGFYPKQSSQPDQYPNVVIAVEDLDQAMKDINKNGGKVVGEPMDVPGYGRSVSFHDTEGNRVSVIQPLAEMIPPEKD